MEYKNKLLIIYHSGAGSTKTIAEIYYKMLDVYSVDISPISFEYDYRKLHDYNFIIFAFPTYNCSPSTSMKEFIKNIPVFDKSKKSFVFTTCGLYSGNALREFIKGCSSKNIIINGYSVYRAPATDGVLLFPPLQFMFNYEKNIAFKIKSDIKRIHQIINNDDCVPQYPSFKLYEILNYPNKVAGKVYKHKLSIIKESCVNCKKCANNCIRKCWNTSGEVPKYEGEKCEFCFRCVHHCLSGAIILSGKTKSKTKLDEKFYKNLKEKIISEIL